MKGKYLQFCLGVVAGGVLFSTTATAADYLTARASTQRFYLNGQPVQFEAYEIHGNNFVKLRDIGQAVDFGVTYDGSTNSVHIDPNAHYEQEVTPPAQTTPAPSVLTEETVRATIKNLRERYPVGSVYETPYRPNNPLDRPFDNCDHCAGWAMLCSDAAFGDLPWRRVDNPRWKLAGQSGVPMQQLLIAVPDEEEIDITTVKLTVKKLEAGTNKPLVGVSFKVENANDPSAFSVTKATGSDGTLILTKEADGLAPGQYLITEESVPEGYVAQTASQLVTVLPNGSANSVFTFYNEPTTTTTTPGTGSIRKVNADNPTEGIPGAVIRITSVKLDDGGSYFGEFVTKEGGYISKEDLDFSKLPTGAYLAEEITPPEGFILSSDVSRVKQPFVWDGKTDVSLVFENSAKVKVQLKKVDESGQPLAGAIFVVLRDGQVIATEETGPDGTITVSHVTEGYYQFREVSAPAGFDCDRSPVGVHVNAEDLQGEQTIVVEKMNHHKRALTVSKRDLETGAPIANTSFHVSGVNLGYENDVVTGADGTVTLRALRTPRKTPSWWKSMTM